MQRTLFVVPHEIWGIPLFGTGLLLGVVLLVLAGLLLAAIGSEAVRRNLPRHLATLAIAAVAVVFVLPMLEIRSASGQPLGLAVRGYGVMLLLGVCSGVALAVYRAKQKGIDPDHIFGVAPWAIVAGIVGARLFYVIEYRDSYISNGQLEWSEVLRFFQGGLVVFGSIIGGFPVFVWYCWKNKISFPRFADALIPCLFIGLFFGRIGCLMNGCCYGGRCEEAPWALHFPSGSPVYLEQLTRGDLIGITVQEGPAGQLQVQSVRRGSLADRAGIQAGEIVRGIQAMPAAAAAADDSLPADDQSRLSVQADIGGRLYRWSADELPQAALPVLPAQVISSIGALLIALMLIALTPAIKIDGLLATIGFAAYSVARFLLEFVRSDEPGQFGTSLTISQIVSIGVLAASVTVAAYLIYQSRHPRARPGGAAKAVS